MISVLQSCLRYDPAVGGVETYVRDVVSIDPPAGDFTSRVLTSDFLTHTTEARIHDYVDPDHVTRVSPRDRNRLFPYQVFKGYRRAASTLIDGTDVIHAHAVYYGSWDRAIALARRYDKALVATAYFYPRHRLWWRAYLDYTKRTMAGPLQLVVAISAFEEAMLRRYSVVPDNAAISIVPPLVIGPEALPVRSESGPLRLLFLGRLDAGKGVVDLVQMALRLRACGAAFTIRVAGPDGGQMAALRSLAEDQLHEGELQILGPVSDSTKTALLSTSDFLVLPTRYEAFGIVLAEAMAYGAVPVAYDVGSTGEVLGGGRFGGLAELGSPADLADHVLRLASDSAALTAQRQAAAEHVRHSYGAQRWVASWRDIYRTAVGDRPGSAAAR